MYKASETPRRETDIKINVFKRDVKPDSLPLSKMSAGP